MSFLAKLYRLFFIFIFSFTLRSPFIFFLISSFCANRFFFLYFLHAYTYISLHIYMHIRMYIQGERRMLDVSSMTVFVAK